MPETIYEHIDTKQTLNRVKEERMPFDWSINPYRGCAHGCSFCYARAFQSFIGRGAEDEFQHHILLKQNAPDALEGQLSRLAGKFGYDIEAMRRHIGQVTIGTATDPYQPIEAKAQLTRECLKLLAKYRISTSITTRSPLITRDLDILTQMKDISVNISINSLDAGLIRRIEPASPHPQMRLETVQKLAESGVHVGIFAAPILPLLTDSEESMDALLSAAKGHGAAFAMVSLLRLSKDVKAWYMGTLRTHYPALVEDYAELYGQGPYAERQYIDMFKGMSAALLRKHGLSAIPGEGEASGPVSLKGRIPGSDSITPPGSDSTLGSIRRTPSPSVRVKQEEIQLRAEQLSFDF
ncbi:radical SAM protein [Paenibacillus zeisoli]|uniref:Radical SAM protein n=1 Tax=Paenibacillus zeisoli TaxID=2496267 RepID=A0A433X1L1_9BACL|nr:radical SAM protein [Paenibacillus zeisoli]RUT28004.1 radical SAM protein [Paenibacillus zeisoli]